MGARLASLLLKESIQFFRDKVTLILILWLYTIEVILCANAMSFDVKKIPLAILDLDRTPASRALQERFVETEAFALVGQPASETEVEDWLQSGRAGIALVIRKGFASELERGGAPVVQILLDGSNSNTAAIARGYALHVIDRFERTAAHAESGTHVSARPVLRAWYNPSETFTSYMTLGMIAIAGFLVGAIHAAAPIVREKEAGTIEQLMVAPIRTGELFLAKTLPTMAMGLISVFPSLLIASQLGVPLRGSLLLFLALTAVYLLSAISFGVLIATMTRTLQQALLLSFFGIVPIIFLSGTLVPIESMPVVLQYISLASPLRHFLDVILGIFLKGTGLAELWRQAAALVIIGTLLFAYAASVFRRRLS